MNDTIETTVAGTRSRSSPRMSSGTGVVPASTRLAPKPRSVLAAVFQAAHRPSRDSSRPPTPTCSPPATNGTMAAKTRNGTMTVIRLTSCRGRYPTTASMVMTTTASTAKAHTVRRGVSATPATKARTAAIFTSGARAWSGECPWTSR